MFLVPFEGLLQEPAAWMERICGFLEVPYHASLLRPTKAGQPVGGQFVRGAVFRGISAEPVDRWKKFLSEEEIGWVEWHCRDFMEPLGYEPTLPRRSWKHWARPVRGETLKEYCKSRLYSMRRWPRAERWLLLLLAGLMVAGGWLRQRVNGGAHGSGSTGQDARRGGQTPTGPGNRIACG